MDVRTCVGKIFSNRISRWDTRQRISWWDIYSRGYCGMILDTAHGYLDLISIQMMLGYPTREYCGGIQYTACGYINEISIQDTLPTDVLMRYQFRWWWDIWPENKLWWDTLPVDIFTRYLFRFWLDIRLRISWWDTLSTGTWRDIYQMVVGFPVRRSCGRIQCPGLSSQDINSDGDEISD